MKNSNSLNSAKLLMISILCTLFMLIASNNILAQNTNGNKGNATVIKITPDLDSLWRTDRVKYIAAFSKRYGITAKFDYGDKSERKYGIINVMKALEGKTPAEANEILGKLYNYINEIGHIDFKDKEMIKFKRIYDDAELEYMQAIENLTKDNK